jgi:hypothetical protein
MFPGDSRLIERGSDVISSLEVFSAQSDAPELALGDLMENQGPIQVRNIEGLGPVKADINTQALATRGVLLQGTSVGARNIVLTLGLNPDWVDYTVASLRQLLYRYFLPEQWVKLRFTSNVLPPVEIEGYVESTDPNIFSEDPEVQVSVICPRPDFIDPEAHTVEGIVHDASTPTGDIVDLVYTGTVETGFELIVGAGDSSSFQLLTALNLDVGQLVGDPSDLIWVPGSGHINLSGLDLDLTDHYLRMNTSPGSKRVSTVEFGGAETNVMRNATTIKWPKFTPGTNKIFIVGYIDGWPDELIDPPLPWKIAYYNRYAGL